MKTIIQYKGGLEKEFEDRAPSIDTQEESIDLIDSEMGVLDEEFVTFNQIEKVTFIP